MIIAIGSPLIGIIAVISTSYKAEARVLSFVLVQVVLGLYFYIRAFAKGKCFFNSFFWKYALSFNIPLIPHYLSMTVLNQSDRIMIDKMVGTSEAAIYGIAYTLAMMMTIITGAINSSFIPYTYQNIKRKHYKQQSCELSHSLNSSVIVFSNDLLSLNGKSVAKSQLIIPFSFCSFA